MKLDLSSIIFEFQKEIHRMKESCNFWIAVKISCVVVCHKNGRRLIQEYFPGIGHLHYAPILCIDYSIFAWKILAELKIVCELIIDLLCSNFGS